MSGESVKPRAIAIEMRPSIASSAYAAVILAFTLGCEDEIKQATPKPTRAIIGKKTQDIRDSSQELKAQGARVGSAKITVQDPITLSGNAYVVSIGKISILHILHIQHALDLYQAEHDSLPATYEDFMKDIIKANNIGLPVLPYYQEYGYDEMEHKLLILEYPDRKKAQE